MLTRRHFLPLLFGCLSATALLAAPSNSLLRNGTFDANLAGWSTWYAPGQSEGQARWISRDGGGALHAVVTRADRSSSVQLYQGPLPVKEGTWYQLSFEARAEAAQTMRVALMRNSAPYGLLGLSAEVHLASEWQRFTLLAQATGDSEDARIDFFPGATSWLDEVALVELGTAPKTWPVRKVLPGRGWGPDTANVADGNPRTFAHAGGYPTLPLLMTLDLGATKPVGAVLVRGEDRGRHLSTEALECEVSANGRDWYRWGEFTKSSQGSQAGNRPTRFLVSNVAVPARYVRLRIARLRNTAYLSDVQVLAAEDAEESALTSFPPVSPAANVVFAGWDYQRLGYDLSPGETPALRFVNQESGWVELPVRWRLETYAGEQVAAAETEVTVEGLGTAEAPVELPAGLQDGPYRLRFTAGDTDSEQAFYFDYRGQRTEAALNLTVAALLDCQDPEGYARLAAGPVAPFLNLRRSLPADTRAVDVALVATEDWTADAPPAVALRRYLRSGGRALFFGKISEALDDLLPVRIDREDPWISTPLRLRQPTFWPSFDRSKCPRQFGVRAEVKPGAQVLATWETGAPAVVQSADGRVVWIGAGLGRCWQRPEALTRADELVLHALYHLVGRSAAPAALTQLGSATGQVPHRGVSAGNVGRFGWLVQEAGLVENLSDTGELRCPTDATPWRLTVPGAATNERGTVTALNWLAKEITWRAGKPDSLRCTVSLGSPCLLWEGAAHRLRIEGDFTHVAYQSKAGVRIASRGDQFVGSDMVAGWLVLWTAREELRDSPKLVVLKSRPTNVRIDDAIELTFAAPGFGAAWTGRLEGVRRLAPGETLRWTESFPETKARQAAELARRCLRFPVAVEETYAVNEGAVVLTNRFTYRSFSDDWNTQPQTLAPLPPVLALLRQHAATLLPVQGEVLDLGTPTKHGPLQAVAGDTLRYTIPLATTDHFGVIPTTDRMDLAKEIDHYGVTGIESVKRASGGLTTSDSFLFDLREYMSSGGHESPFAASCIDLYKWWYCFPTVCARPAFGSEARVKVDAYHRQHYWETLNFYPHKTLVRHRREPWTGLDYSISFIWPTLWRDGVRYFVDQNESAAVVMYCLWSYAQYYGDWDTVASNWNLVRGLHSYLPRVHDWAFMCSSNQEFFSTVGVDMLNSEYPGNLAFARLAEQVGDEDAAALGRYLAAKAQIPTVARLFFPEYVASITAPGDPWREGKFYWSLQETGFKGSKDLIMRGDTNSILWLAIGMLDTSKGTSPEICALYKRFAPGALDAYERAVKQAEAKYNNPAGAQHLMNRAFLGWPRDELIATGHANLTKRPNQGWQATKAPHNFAAVCVADQDLYLTDWAPAEYVSGAFDPQARRATLVFDNHTDRPCVVRFYSRRPVETVTCTPGNQAEWRWETGTGRGHVTLPAPGRCTVTVTLGAVPEAPPSCYSPSGATPSSVRVDG